MASCYVEGCTKYSVLIPVPISGSGGWEMFPESSDQVPCVHVAACLQNGREASAYPVKHSVLNSISVSGDWKQKIWLKARSDGPLVQRVSASAVPDFII